MGKVKSKDTEGAEIYKVNDFTINVYFDGVYGGYEGSHEGQIINGRIRSAEIPRHWAVPKPKSEKPTPEPEATAEPEPVPAVVVKESPFECSRRRWERPLYYGGMRGGLAVGQKVEVKCYHGGWGDDWYPGQVTEIIHRDGYSTHLFNGAEIFYYYNRHSYAPIVEVYRGKKKSKVRVQKADGTCEKCKGTGEVPGAVWGTNPCPDCSAYDQTESSISGKLVYRGTGKSYDYY